MRLLRMMALVAVAALVALGPTSTGVASASEVTEDKVHVENLTAVVNKTGAVTIDGLVICDFATNPDDPDVAEVTATLTQHGISDYSNGDFVYCGGPLDVAPLGGNHVTNYLYFKPGRALLHLTFGLCDAEVTATVCGSYSYDGYITIRKA
jgi:hypothetical protein